MSRTNTFVSIQSHRDWTISYPNFNSPNLNSVNLASPKPASTLVVDESPSLKFLEDAESIRLLTGPRLTLVMASFVVLNALVGLNQTILAPVLGLIISDVASVSNSDMAWISSAFLFAQSAIFLIGGKCLCILPPKLVLAVSIVVFECGCLFCAGASSSGFLIFGRAVAGLGMGVVWIATLSIIARISILNQKTLFIGMNTTVFGIFLIIGPFLGLELASIFDKITWRFCFYINLPIGLLAGIVAFINLPYLPSLVVRGRSDSTPWSGFDWVGAALNITGVLLFLIGLQWGGNGSTTLWHSPVVLTLMLLGIGFVGLFLAWEGWKNWEALLPFAIFKKRNVLGSFFLAAFLGLGLVTAASFLSVIYQLRGHSATRSISLDILPFLLSASAGGALDALFLHKTGRLMIMSFFPPLLAAIGFAFLSISNLDTSLGQLAGYQILLGFGLMMSLQNAYIMVQIEYRHQEDLIPQATSLIAFGAFTSIAIGSIVTSTIFSAVFNFQVRNLDLPDAFNTTPSSSQNAVGVISSLPGSLQLPVINAFFTALNRTFVVGIVASAAASLSALFMERKRFFKESTPSECPRFSMVTPYPRIRSLVGIPSSLRNVFPDISD